MESISKLRAICQHTKEGEFYKIDWFERILYRKLSIYFTRLCLEIGLSANQVTYISLLVGIIAGTLLIFDAPMWWIVSAFLFYFYNLLDNVDGEIARYNRSQSMLGGFLDSIVFSFVWRVMLVCMSIYIYRAFDAPIALVVGLGAMLFLHVFTMSGMIPFRVAYYEKGRGGSKAEEHNHEKSGENQVSSFRLIHIAVHSIHLSMYLLLVVGLIDYFFSHFTIGSVDFNARYIYLFIISIASFFAGVARFYYTVHNKASLQHF